MLMRKQEKAIIWPAYFDQAKTRQKGRRIPRNLAVQSPKIEEIQEAARKLGLNPEVSVGAGYPKASWDRAGMLRVEKKTSKEQIIKKIARQLLKMRSAPSQQK
jgi:signal recognition particle subunit SRP19